MSTHSVIAKPLTKTKWQGSYVHQDGGPCCQGPVLWSIIKHQGLDQATKILVDTYYSWNYLAEDIGEDLKSTAFIDGYGSLLVFAGETMPRPLYRLTTNANLDWFYLLHSSFLEIRRVFNPFWIIYDQDPNAPPPSEAVRSSIAEQCEALTTLRASWNSPGPNWAQLESRSLLQINHYCNALKKEMTFIQSRSSLTFTKLASSSEQLFEIDFALYLQAKKIYTTREFRCQPRGLSTVILILPGQSSGALGVQPLLP